MAPTSLNRANQKLSTRKVWETHFKTPKNHAFTADGDGLRELIVNGHARREYVFARIAIPRIFDPAARIDEVSSAPTGKESPSPPALKRKPDFTSSWLFLVHTLPILKFGTKISFRLKNECTNCVVSVVLMGTSDQSRGSE